jgi:hypothetical protein
MLQFVGEENFAYQLSTRQAAILDNIHHHSCWQHIKSYPVPARCLSNLGWHFLYIPFPPRAKELEKRKKRKEQGIALIPPKSSG